MSNDHSDDKRVHLVLVSAVCVLMTILIEPYGFLI